MAASQFLVLLQTINGLHLVLSHHWSFLNANPNLPDPTKYHGGGHSYFPQSYYTDYRYLPPASAGRNSSLFQGFAQTTQPPPGATTLDPRSQNCGLAPAQCFPARYRSYDGSCNNLRNPVWGTPQTRYARLLPPIYGDGISTPTLSRSGRMLPGSRELSLDLHPDVPVRDPRFTLAAMQYGQIITHDMSMIAGSTQAQPHSTRCCSDDGRLLELANIPEHCYPIVLPDNDPVYGRTNTRCMNFVRTITDRDRNCVGGYQPAEQLTAVNHYLDLSITYGNNDQDAQGLREGTGGRLRIERRNGQTWPPQTDNVTGICDADDATEPCYQAGDARVNQNPQLTILQIIFLREHNRLADALATLNPQWDDERIFQEARQINIGQHQQITYYEWLPLFLGLENTIQHKIVYPGAKGFVNDYDESINPSVLNEHATAAFRYFHTLIAGYLDLLTETRNGYGNIRLSDWFNRPLVLEGGNVFDDLTRGMATQPELKADPFMDSEVTQFLFRMRQQFGSDLRAIDIHRNRDHGLASYNDYRSLCGLPKVRNFDGFLDAIPAEHVQKLATFYETPDDVDLTVGAFLETHVPGTLAGPTFLCILVEQFYRTRKGDRYFYENGDINMGFTEAQLNEIRKASISRLFCDNGRDIRSMQPRGFERVSDKNPIVPCDTLPAIDLSLWKDGASSRSFLDIDFPFISKK
ncbi:peroxidase [Agrilus planipennis]|uniref:Peroxidase n=1 Tax=Agrilus planipennis TaxID=224129 RepID=A0A1W4WMG7_AGRPL|nr:peroxidase [Agrilus planipennis]XP_025828884.1 peroxidase [Agrilus planipennis]